MKSPNCNDSPEYLLSLSWLDELAMLISRHQGLGITPDLAGMSLIESYGLLLHLRSLGG